jgi:hypothetical protein
MLEKIIKAVDIAFKTMAVFRYLGTTVTNQKLIGQQ